MFFFFNDTATTEIYTLSLHDALPIFGDGAVTNLAQLAVEGPVRIGVHGEVDRLCHGHAADIRLGDQRVYLHLRSEEHTSELQSLTNLVCRLLLEKKKIK